MNPVLQSAKVVMPHNVFLCEKRYPPDLRRALKSYATRLAKSEACPYDLAVAQSLVVFSKGFWGQRSRDLADLKKHELALRARRNEQPWVYGLNLAAQLVHLWRADRTLQGKTKAIVAYGYLLEAPHASDADLLRVIIFVGEFALKQRVVSVSRLAWVLKHGSRHFERCKGDPDQSSLVVVWNSVQGLIQQKLDCVRDEQRYEIKRRIDNIAFRPAEARECRPRQLSWQRNHAASCLTRESDGRDDLNSRAVIG